MGEITGTRITSRVEQVEEEKTYNIMSKSFDRIFRAAIPKELQLLWTKAILLIHAKVTNLRGGLSFCL